MWIVFTIDGCGPRNLRVPSVPDARANLRRYGDKLDQLVADGGQLNGAIEYCRTAFPAATAVEIHDGSGCLHKII